MILTVPCRRPVLVARLWDCHGSLWPHLEGEGRQWQMLLLLAMNISGPHARCRPPHALWINPLVFKQLFIPILQTGKLSPREVRAEPPTAHSSPLGCRYRKIKTASDITPQPRDEHCWHPGRAHDSVFPSLYVCKYGFHKQNWNHAVYAVSCVLTSCYFVDVFTWIS